MGSARTLRLSALTVFTVLLAAPAMAQNIPEQVLRDGKADYMTYCAVCHGKRGTGDGPVAKHLTTNPADLSAMTKHNAGTFPEDRVHQVIDGRQEVMGHGTRDMPIWGNWFKFVARTQDAQGTDNETSEIIVALRIQGLIEHIKTLQKK